jgi:hypothetical protein
MRKDRRHILDAVVPARLVVYIMFRALYDALGTGAGRHSQTSTSGLKYRTVRVGLIEHVFLGT